MSTSVGEYKAATAEGQAARAEDKASATEERAGRNGVERKSAPASTRMVSLDVFRGLTIAGMILVNNPGTWDHIYSPLEHSKWHGWTPTDLVFPFFLFIVGVSITLALSRRAEAGGGRRDVYLKIIRRTLLIYALGTFLVFGMNALAVFFLTGIFARLLTLIKLNGADGKSVALQTFIFRSLFASWASPANASLAFALCFVLLWLGLMALLYRRGIFIKV